MVGKERGFGQNAKWHHPKFSLSTGDCVLGRAQKEDLCTTESQQKRVPEIQLDSGPKNKVNTVAVSIFPACLALRAKWHGCFDEIPNLICFSALWLIFPSLTHDVLLIFWPHLKEARVWTCAAAGVSQQWWSRASSQADPAPPPHRGPLWAARILEGRKWDTVRSAPITERSVCPPWWWMVDTSVFQKQSEL